MRYFVTILFAFFVLTPMVAQSQEGSVAIAKTVVPASEYTVDSFSACVEKMIGLKIESKQAIEACKEAAKLAAKTATRIANEAADATKASRPVVVAPYNHYGRYWSRSWAGFTVGYGDGRGFRDRRPRYSRR